MKEINLHWVFEIEYGYAEDELPLTATKKIKVDEDDPEFSDFIDWIIYICEEYSLMFAGSHKDSFGTLYYDFYNFNNTHYNVNLVIEVRVTNYNFISNRYMKQASEYATNVFNNGGKNGTPKMYPFDIKFNKKNCETLAQACLLLQKQLKELNRLYNTKEKIHKGVY